jgi:hypothetical protein
MSHGLTAASQYEQAEHGKIELSLLQFSVSFHRKSKTDSKCKLIKNHFRCQRRCDLIAFVDKKSTMETSTIPSSVHEYYQRKWLVVI